MDERVPTRLPPEHGYADWLTAVAPAMRTLDWQSHMQVDDLGEGVSIALLDVLPPEDVELVVEGPPTFSISVFVEGEGTVSIDGGEPLAITPGTAVICSTDRIVGGVDVMRGGSACGSSMCGSSLTCWRSSEVRSGGTMVAGCWWTGACRNAAR